MANETIDIVAPLAMRTVNSVALKVADVAIRLTAISKIGLFLKYIKVSPKTFEKDELF